MPKIKIRQFRGLRDYYMSWGMQPVRGGRALAVIGRLTIAALEGSLANFTTPIAYDLERTTGKAVALTDNAYVWTSVTGISSWTALGNNSGFDNNMIVDQNDSIFIFSDGAIKYWDVAGGRSWEDPTYAFANGVANVFHPAALIQQYLIIGDGNIIARIDTTSGSYAGGDFTASALTMPAGYVASAIAQKGESYKRAIIAFNRNKKGVIVTWDCVSENPDSIIPVGEEIHALVTAEDNRTYAIIGNGVLYDISAFPIVPVFSPPDNEAQLTISDFRSFPANALETSRRKIYIGYSGGSAFNRHKAGVWVYDIDTRNAYPLGPISSGDQKVASVKAMKALEIGNQYRIFVGSQDSAAKGRHDYINDNPLANGAFYISPITRSRIKSRLKGIKFNISQFLQGEEENSLSVVITASYFNFKKRLWARGIEDTEAPATDKIEIDNGATIKPLLGEEITILEKSNAGYVRRITDVDLVSDPNIFTLDSAMSATKTETAVQMNISPFIRLNTKSITITEGGEVYIKCKDKPLFKELLIKIQIQVASGGIPVISDLDIIHEYATDPR